MTPEDRITPRLDEHAAEIAQLSAEITNIKDMIEDIANILDSNMHLHEFIKGKLDGLDARLGMMAERHERLEARVRGEE